MLGSSANYDINSVTIDDNIVNNSLDNTGYIASKSIGLNFKENEYLGFDVYYYQPRDNTYNSSFVIVADLDGYLQASNEIIFDFENEKFYVNDFDATDDMLNRVNIDRLEQITIIKVGM